MKSQIGQLQISQDWKRTLVEAGIVRFFFLCFNDVQC